jgi:hypothetical protein
MICRQCGHANEPGARFCSSCGAPLDREDVTANLDVVDSDEAPAPLDSALEQLPEGVAVVVVRRGPNAGSVFGLEGDEVAAGRHPDSEIFLDDVTVSRRHAVIERLEGGYGVRDAGSLNGTYVNHERVDEAPLHDGDEVQIGRFVLTFHIGGGP